MNDELLLSAIDLFDSPESWDAFCDLRNLYDRIHNGWWQKLQKEVFQREKKNPTPDWDIDIFNYWDIRWSLKDYGKDMLVVHFWGDTFRVFYNYGGLDVQKVNDMLKNPKYDSIHGCMDRIDGSNHETIAWEHRNFYFGDKFDGKFPNSAKLSWYAGNRTNEFADQLIAKVRKFQTPEITQLFKEINEGCKKS